MSETPPLDEPRAAATESPPSSPSRRTFLRRTLAGAVLLGAGGLLARHATGYAVPREIAARLRVLTPKQYVILAAIVRRLLASDGESPAAPSPDELETALVVDEYLAGLDGALRSDVQLLLELVEHTPFLFTLRPSRFTRLDAAAQDAVLADWESSHLDVRRQGFVALKGLACLGYWGDARTFPVVGYGGPLLDGGGHGDAR